MTSAEKLAAKTGITIHSGETFYIDADLDMNAGTQIFVNQFGLGGNGGKLFIMSRLYCSTGTWNGVKVFGTSGPHHLSPPNNAIFNDFAAYRGVLNPDHGYVELWTGTKIEKAEHGVWSLNGGIIQSWIVPGQPNAKFIDCREGIYIENCQQNPSAIRINKCELTWTSPNIWGQPDYNSQFVHITVNNSKDAYFGGCILSGDNANSSGIKYNYDDKGVGFLMYGSGSSATFGEAGDAFFSDPQYCTPIVRYRMQSSTPEPGSISNLSIGLVASGDELGVNHTTFNNNMIGIGELSGSYTFLTSFVDLHDNTFYNSDWMLYQQFRLSPAIKNLVYIRANQATIYDNTFVEDQGIFTGGGTAAYVFPYTSSPLLDIYSNSISPSDFLVYRNSFNGSEASNGTSSVMSPIGLAAGGNLSGLEWKCNTFENLDKGVSYSGSAGPTDNPISGTASNNKYINCTTLDIDNGTSVPLQYYYNSMDLPPNTTLNVRPIGVTVESPLCDLDCSTVRTKNKVDNTAQTAAVEELVNNEFGFYPNPAQDKLTVLYDGNTHNAEMTIYSMQGQEVLRTSVVSGQSYDVSSLTNGFYNISLDIDGHREHATLIIAK